MHAKEARLRIVKTAAYLVVEPACRVFGGSVQPLLELYAGKPAQKTVAPPETEGPAEVSFEEMMAASMKSLDAGDPWEIKTGGSWKGGYDPEKRRKK